MKASVKTGAARSLAGQRDWPGILQLYEREKSGTVLLDLAANLEELGTQHLESHSWFDALFCCHLAQWPATHSAGKRFPESKLQDFNVRVYHLTVKLQGALETGAKESGFWEKVAAAGIAIARTSRFDDAGQILTWLQNSGDRQWATALEKAADSTEEATVQLWLLQRAREAFLIYKRKADAERLSVRIDEIESAAEQSGQATPPPEEDDQRRLREAAREARCADWDRKLATPLPGDPLPAPLTWDAGLDRAEWLALRGRTEDADDLLRDLRQTLGKPGIVFRKTTDGNQQVERYFEEVARHIGEHHPNLAEWFRERSNRGVFAEPRKLPEEFTRSLRTLIRNLETCLAEVQPEQLAALQPGVSAQQLDQFEARFRVKLPRDFRDLYRWRNGQPLSGSSLDYHRLFVPLEEVAETKGGLDAMIGVEFRDPKLWRRGWVPFEDCGYSGNYLCLDLTTSDDGDYGQIVSYYHGEPNRPIEFASLREWLDQFVEALDHGY